MLLKHDLLPYGDRSGEKIVRENLTAVDDDKRSSVIVDLKRTGNSASELRRRPPVYVRIIFNRNFHRLRNRRRLNGTQTMLPTHRRSRDELRDSEF